MLLTIVLAAVLSADPDVLETVKLFDAAGDAARFAKTAHLTSLGQGGPEVRVWSTGFGGTVGWTITDSEIRIYSGNDSDGDIRPQRTIKNRVRASELLRLFSALADFDGKPIACTGVRDGSSVAIEGIDSTRSFSVYVANPDFCNVAGARQASKAISRLVKVAPRTP
jgi:hypothetical protein